MNLEERKCSEPVFAIRDVHDSKLDSRYWQKLFITVNGMKSANEMSKSCQICKLDRGILDDVSFHSFPKEQEMRDKWSAAIGKEISDRGYVCSQHFEEKNFYYKVFGNGVRRYLFNTSVPSAEIINDKRSKHANEEWCRKNQKIVSLPGKYGIYNAYIIVDDDDGDDGDSSPSQADSEISIKIEDSDKNLNEIEQPIITDEIETETVKVECSDVKDKNLDVLCNIFYTINELDAIEKNKNKKSTSKRKDNEPEIPRKKRRFSNARTVGDLTRRDFTSDAAWEMVKNYVMDTKKNERLASKTMKSLSDKNTYLEKLLEEIKRRQRAKCETKSQ
ncbi:uncharacterized protein LOC106637845 [Copidosoma floridanum]|uniref:uncharacterized protein LOC106637845 n=1 Tax=Copidosoma floridanum TaxID=29053 RepID=UPI0006C99A6D|nr:uncharacterized protein LOC106637845 [Copidosoma floridanum]